MLRTLISILFQQASRFSARTRDVLLCTAPVPERNRGDQALLAVAIKEIQKRGSTRITVLATSEQEVLSLPIEKNLEIRHDLYHLFLTRRSFREEVLFQRIAMKHKHFCVIGADVLDEGYSVERSVSSLHTLWLANELGLDSRIFGFSVNGPPSSGLAERLARIGKSTRLFVRDPLSFERLETAGVQGIERAGDLAYLLEPSPIEQLPSDFRSFAQGNQDRLIGLNLTNVVLGDPASEERKLQIIAEACRSLRREFGYRFLLLPHDEPEGVEYLGAFRNRLGEEMANDCYLVSPLPHCRVLKAIAGYCTHVFTCRLHLGIATLGMGRPITGFPYQGKFEGQLQLFGLGTDSLIYGHDFPSCSEHFAKVMQSRIAQSEALSIQIRQHLPKVRQLVHRNFDGIGHSTNEFQL